MKLVKGTGILLNYLICGCFTIYLPRFDGVSPDERNLIERNSLERTRLSETVLSETLLSESLLSEIVKMSM